MVTQVSESLRLQLTKVVRASRERAFAAWTEAEQLKQWFGPGAMLPAEASVDLRVGGGFRFVIAGVSPRSGEHMSITFQGSFLEIIADRKLSFDWAVAGDPGEPTLVTVEFNDVPEGTEVVLTQERIPSADLLARNQMGWGGMLEKLSGLFV